MLLGVGIAAALLAVGGLIGASFVKSPQQLAADTAAPPATVTTAAVVSQILTSSVEMRGVIYPATEYDVYPSAPSRPVRRGSASSGCGRLFRRRIAGAGVHLEAGRRGRAARSATASSSPSSTASRCSR